MPWNVGHQRPRAGGDQDLVGGDRRGPTPAAPDSARSSTARSWKIVDIVVGQRLGVGAFEPADLGQHIVAQHRPVEALFRHVPAEHRRVVEVLGEMRAVDEQLLGHAAADDAGAADLIFLGDRDPRAIAPPTRAPRARRPIRRRSRTGRKSATRRPPVRSARGSRGRAPACSPSPSSSRAMSLPSSTPNWSNGLMPSSTALAKVRCS